MSARSKCPICGKGGKLFELPMTLRALGYKTSRAHPSCVRNEQRKRDAHARRQSLNLRTEARAQ